MYLQTFFYLNIDFFLKLAHFPKYAEIIPNGETCNALSEAAKKNEIYVIGGTIPERDGDKLYNTATVWDPQGKLIAKYRKVLCKYFFFKKAKFILIKFAYNSLLIIDTFKIFIRFNLWEDNKLNCN